MSGGQRELAKTNQMLEEHADTYSPKLNDQLESRGQFSLDYWESMYSQSLEQFNLLVIHTSTWLFTVRRQMRLLYDSDCNRLSVRVFSCLCISQNAVAGPVVHPETEWSPRGYMSTSTVLDMSSEGRQDEVSKISKVTTVGSPPLISF